MVSHDHEEQAKSRPAEAALIADPRAIDIFGIEIVYVSNSLFWCRFWREFSCKCIESAICACPHDRPHIDALKYSWIIVLYNHIKHTLRFI